MKKIISTLLTLGSLSAFSAPQYTLQAICEKYGNFNQCSTVPFCQEKSFEPGCYLAQGAPAHVEGLCKLQTAKQGCSIMEQQGNCVWLEESTSVCNAKIQKL